MSDVNKTKYKRFLPRKLIASVALLSVFPAVSAVVLEEVIVTAQKKSQSVQDIPVSINALSSEMLSDTGIDTQRLLAQTVTNFQISNTGLFAAPYIRGVGTTFANAGLEPSVATYFDDQYFSRPSGGMWSFSDVERVEVLKGPQGTLYGRNATGGAVRIITKDPTDEFEASISGSVGSFNQRGLEGMISGPLSENVRGRLVLQSDENDGYVENIVPGRPDYNDRDQVFARGKLIWDATDDITAKFTAHYSKKEDFDGLAFQPAFTTAPQHIGVALGGTPPPDFHKTAQVIYNDIEFEIENYGAVIRIDYTRGDLEISSITSYLKDEFGGAADLDGTELPLFDSLTESAETEDLSQEFQIVSSYDGKLNFTAGLFLYKSEADYAYGLAGLLIGANPIASYDAVEIQSIAPYGEIYYDINDQWKLTLGARYTDEEKELTDHQFFLGTGVDDNVITGKTLLYSQPSKTLDFKEFTPRVVLSYQPSDDLMLYASFSRGFKSGGFSTPLPDAANVGEVDTEVLDAWEFGWKSTIADRITFNGAIFHYDYEDLQVQLVEGGTNVTKNAANAKIDGIEIDLTIAVTDQLEVNMGAGYLDTEYEDYLGDSYALCMNIAACLSDPLAGGLGIVTLAGTDLSGNDLLLAPKFTAYFRASYFQPLPEGMGSITSNLLYSYSGDYNYTPDGFFTEDSKGLLSAGIKWLSSEEHVEVALSGQNLTNKEYSTGKTAFAVGGWQVPAAPRTWKLQVAYNF